MSWSVAISEAAEEDLRAAFLWYEDQLKDLGLRFKEHVEQAISSIKSNPLKTQIRYNSVRVYFLKHFPYGVHYQLRDADHVVLIVAVFHTAQNSKNWERRV